MCICMWVCFLTSFSLFISACSSLNGSSNLVNNPFASYHYFLTQNQGNIFSLAKKETYNHSQNIETNSSFHVK